VTKTAKSSIITIPDWLVNFSNANMETLAYIYLACACESSDTIDPADDFSEIKVVRGLKGKKPKSRTWIRLVSLLAASTVIGMAAPATAQIEAGSRGQEVAELQQQLRELGYFDRPSTGNFGPLTKQAVIRFQQDEGLTPDGVVETKTKAALLRRLGRSDAETPPADTQAATATPETVRRITLRRGARGKEVEALQKLLAAAGVYEGSPNGQFDGKTFTAVRQFQRKNRLGADGIVGGRTWSALLDSNGNAKAATPFNRDPFLGENGTTVQTPPSEGEQVGGKVGEQVGEQVTAAIIEQGSKGSQVRELQQRLQELGYFNGRTTGNFGPLTKAAVIKFQQDSGLTASGVVDEATKAALQTKAGSASNLSVRDLQQRLKERGFYSGAIDGNLNEQTKAAIKAAQRAYGVSEADILQARF
jgi:peptidoglycan hydrolase-like protein with peptidoglycan-binding domain